MIKITREGSGVMGIYGSDWFDISDFMDQLGNPPPVLPAGADAPARGPRRIHLGGGAVLRGWQPAAVPDRVRPAGRKGPGKMAG